MVRSLLYSSGLCPVFWSVSLLHVVYLKNRLYHRSIDCTPYFACTGVIPNLAHLCIFGSLITARKPGKPDAKLDRHTAVGFFVGYGSTNRHINYFDRVSKRFKTGNHFVCNEAHFHSSSRPAGAQLLFDLGFRAPPDELILSASKVCFAPQPPHTKLSPGKTVLAQYVPMPLLEFVSAPVAVATTLVAAVPVSRNDALTVEMYDDPFGPSFDEPISIQGHHVAAGLLLQLDIDRGHCQLTSIQPGTPAHHIHTWKSRLCHAYILRIDGNNVISIMDVTHAIQDACLRLASNISVTFTFDEIVNTLRHAGLPQLYFDQMRVVKNHLETVKHPRNNKVSASSTPRLTRQKLQQTDTWPKWRATEQHHVQLNNYFEQGMFGTPTVPPPNSAVFYWVWVYVIKVHKNNRKKARAVCDGSSTRGGTAHVSLDIPLPQRQI
jgi:hypothetical protein